MRGTFTACFVCLVALSWGQPLEHSLLWRISTSSGGTADSYLFGTVHSKDDRAFQFGDSTLAALGRCALVVGELDLDKATSGMLQLFTKMRMGGSKTLEDLYTKKQWERVRTALSEQMGPSAPMAYGLKPFFVMAMLAESEMGDDHSEVLDQYLLNTAKANGQRIFGLETIEEQLEALDAMSLKEQAAMLLDHLDHDGYPGEMDAILDAYVAQDLELLLNSTEKSGKMPKSMEQALLTERNTRMVFRMDSLMNVGESAFFLIGAAHLPGTDGLIFGLREKGYEVVPLLGNPEKFEVPTDH